METAIKNQIAFNYIFMSVCLGQDYQVLDRLKDIYMPQIYDNAFGCFSKGQALLNMEVFPMHTESRASSETSIRTKIIVRNL